MADELDTLIAQLREMADRVGAEFIPDREKVEAYRKAIGDGTEDAAARVSQWPDWKRREHCEASGGHMWDGLICRRCGEGK